MASYAAVISLKQTIWRLLNSSQISILSPSLQILRFAYEEVSSLQDVLQRLESSSSGNSKRVNLLNAQIREAACKLEDAIESNVSHQFLISQSKTLGDDEGSSSLLISLDLKEVKQEIYSIAEMVKKMEEECSKEDSLPKEDDAVSSRIDFGGKNTKIVGFSDQFSKIKNKLAGWWSPKLEIISLIGVAGIGKTTLAMKLFEDPMISSHFELRAFVTLGPKFQLRKILLDILAQMNLATDKIYTERDRTLADYLYKSLVGRRYLIVVDNIWNTQAWVELKGLFPPDNNGSRVLLTTRREGVGQYANKYGVHQMRFLNEAESWDLLREKVFGEEYLCPPELEKDGKKIAKNCEGLPLLILTVACLLSEAERKREYWNEVAEKKNSVFTDAYDQMLEVLLPSYNYLPQHIKACFLYMGVFPPSCEIFASKLIRLWSAEAFLEPNPSKTLKDLSMEYLKELVSNSVVLIHKLSSSSGIKTCKLLSVFQHLCIKVAWQEKFFHVISRYANSSTEGIKSQRRLCIHNNILFGFKDVNGSMESISMAHSLLCTGPYHKYPVPICFELKLLRVLDALTIRFYKFPVEVLKLVQLRYLALTYNGKLPASISKLWKLQYLVVCRHLSIKSSGAADSYLPVEIWDMKELKHLQFIGGKIPNPGCAFLPNLLTLLDVSAHSCTKEVLESIRNLKKLGIQIELVPDAVAEPPLCCFDHLSHLHGLESLKCVMNPNSISQQVIAPPASMSTATFPFGLKKLSLSGFGYPWEDMRIIAKLPNLQVLKLRHFAFRGPVWVTHGDEFLGLRFLLLEDTDLVHWRTSEYYCFPLLEHLIIRHCYKLEEIPSEIGYIVTLQMIEVVDCPSAVDCIEQLQEELFDQGNESLKVCVQSSWEDDGKLRA